MISIPFLQSTTCLSLDNLLNPSCVHNASLKKSSVAHHCRAMTFRPEIQSSWASGLLRSLKTLFFLQGAQLIVLSSYIVLPSTNQK